MPFNDTMIAWQERARSIKEQQEELDQLKKESAGHGMEAGGPLLNSEDLAMLKQEIEQVPAVSDKRKSKGIGRHLVKEAGDKLLKAEQLGLFSGFPVDDKNRIPTLLARLPIFIPIPSKEQVNLLDSDMAFPFDTPFGKGRRFGPTATIEDEDVLLAMIRLSDRRLIGKSEKLPIPIEHSHWLRDEEGRVAVQVLIATESQILEELGLTKGGENYTKLRKTIKRLAHIGIELEERKHERYLGESWEGGVIRLVDIRWKSYDEDGLIFAQFSPVIVRWLKDHATYYNWKIRKSFKRNYNGIALHRFLSTQGNHYKKELEYIADLIHWHGNRSRIKKRVETIMLKLRDEHDWCDFEITGTGKAKPFVLEFWRRKNVS